MGGRGVRWSGNRLVVTAVFLVSSLVVSCSGIKCFSCNSHYDKNCGDPFSNYTTELVNCDQEQHKMTHLPLQEDGSRYTANICRKTSQSISDQVRVIRGCGWLPNPESMKDRDCFTRAGTHEVMVHHCVCKTDSCNSSPQVLTSLPLVLLLSLLSSLLVSPVAKSLVL